VESVGLLVGATLGLTDGKTDGLSVGVKEGRNVWVILGENVGVDVGVLVGYGAMEGNTVTYPCRQSQAFAHLILISLLSQYLSCLSFFCPSHSQLLVTCLLVMKVKLVSSTQQRPHVIGHAS